LLPSEVTLVRKPPTAVQTDSAHAAAGDGVGDALAESESFDELHPPRTSSATMLAAEITTRSDRRMSLLKCSRRADYASVPLISAEDQTAGCVSVSTVRRLTCADRFRHKPPEFT